MSSNSVCNHTRDQTNRTPATRSSDFVDHSYDYRPNWTSLCPVTITNHDHDDETGVELGMFKDIKDK